MNALKDIRIISLILVIAIGAGFESLQDFEIGQKSEDEIGKAGEIFSIHRDSTLSLENKALRRPKNRIQKINAANGVKFDLKAAIANYQKEHGLEEHDFGAKKRPDKLKNGGKNKKKKKSKYEYVFDRKTGKWIKRKKLTPEQRERLLAKRHAERLEAEMKKRIEAEQKKLAENKNKQDIESNDPWNSPATGGQGQQDSPTNPNANENEESSLQAWLDRINENPSKATIYNLINDYRESKVSLGDVFLITKTLTEDPRPEMKELGLIVIDELPSAQSFQLAVNILTSADAYGEIRTRTQKIIEQDYVSISGLGILERVMEVNNDPSVLFVATQTLESAIKNLLKSTGENSYVSRFTPFVSLLTDLTQFGVPEVDSLAQSTLALLQSSLGPPTVASNNF